MKTFLEHVASDIVKRFGNNLSRIAVVFPNKRASLFLDEALVGVTDRVLISPKYFTITDLFLSATNRNIGDRIKLVCMLYQAFRRVTNTDETLEHFYPWGEVMISDFDDIDKHLLSAQQIFTNVGDLHELDSIDYLSDKQKEILRVFFPNQNSDTTRLKKKFLQLWSKLGDIYSAFQQIQEDKNTFYEGAVYREVAERISSQQIDRDSDGNDVDGSLFPCDHYLFVGFNHLLPVEKALFRYLKSQGKALFYWDYDDYYITPAQGNGNKVNEAGEEIVHNLLSYPNALERDDEIFSNFTKRKDIRMLTCATNNIQARYVSAWLKENNRIKKGNKTVIVLADESLLPSVVHSIPPEAGKINITLGYSLALTTIPSLMAELFSSNDYRREGSLGGKVRYLITSITQECTKAANRDALTKESLFRTYTLLNRLSSLVDEGYLDISDQAFQKLFNQLLAFTSVPFHGEPLEGVQIMGVLETRNLDFDDVLMLSCNEGTMPKCNEKTSFIPYFLRKAHSLTTIDNAASTYAYYFYRLLQRAQSVSLMWNKSTEGMSRGEMSRFMLQLLVESPHEVKPMVVKTGQRSPSYTVEAIKKDEGIISALCQRFAHSMSPSALNVYLRCQKKFYYQYVLGLKEYQTEEEEDSDRRIFGLVFHKAVEALYSPFVGREVTATALNEIDKHETIILLVKEKFIETLNEVSSTRNAAKKISSADSFNGLQEIKINVIVSYIHRLIALDKRLAPFRILGIEKYVEGDFDITVGDKVLHTKMAGTIDRQDVIRSNGEEIMRIVDYKTGKSPFESKLRSVEEIFDEMKIDSHSDYYLQACLYSCLVDADKMSNVQPTLLFVQHMPKSDTLPDNFDFNPALCFKQPRQQPVKININDIREEYMEHLHTLTNEIFNIDIPFAAKDPAHAEKGPCAMCPYRTICS